MVCFPTLRSGKTKIGEDNDDEVDEGDLYFNWKAREKKYQLKPETC